MALQEEIEAYRDSHWDEVLADIEVLVSIESPVDESTIGPDAPYGKGPQMALEKALEIAAGYGFDAHNLAGHIGYADLSGATDTQLGIIGHVDVVAAGPDWTVDPFALTKREGYLLGRGVMDDKGPLMVALHALRFWKDRGVGLPYTVRVLIGACEETTMADVDYYRERYEDPAFLFSPDGQFPVCYGEGGIAHGKLMSEAIANGVILDIEGGQATNAVPGQASARVRAKLTPGTYGPITVTAEEDGTALVKASGMSAHASLPHLGVNAIGILVDFLLEEQVCDGQEKEFLELVQSICHNVDGTTLGIDCTDIHFGPITVVASVIEKQGDTFVLWLDFRYPTVITSAQIEQCVNKITWASGAQFIMVHDAVPFLMDLHSEPIEALMKAYRQVTGTERSATTSKGGTYARMFTCGVCFGPDDDTRETPDWVGGLHSADEGVSEESLKEAFTIYALAIGNLMECAL